MMVAEDKVDKGRCKKKVFFGTLSQTMGRWGSKVPNFLVKITIQLFLLQTRFFRTLSQTMGRWGSKVLNFLVKITIQLFLLQTRSFLGLCPKIGVAVGGWGSRVLNKYMEICPKFFSFFQKNKML